MGRMKMGRRKMRTGRTKMGRRKMSAREMKMRRRKMRTGRTKMGRRKMSAREMKMRRRKMRTHLHTAPTLDRIPPVQTSRMQAWPVTCLSSPHTLHRNTTSQSDQPKKSFFSLLRRHNGQELPYLAAKYQSIPSTIVLDDEDDETYIGTHDHELPGHPEHTIPYDDDVMGDVQHALDLAEDEEDLSVGGSDSGDHDDSFDQEVPADDIEALTGDEGGGIDDDDNNEEDVAEQHDTATSNTRRKKSKKVQPKNPNRRFRNMNCTNCLHKLLACTTKDDQDDCFICL